MVNDFSVHCEGCYGIDVKLEDLWVDRDGQRWAMCRSCYQAEHDIGIKRMHAAESPNLMELSLIAEEVDVTFDDYALLREILEAGEDG